MPESVCDLGTSFVEKDMGMNEEQILRSRFKDLAKKAYQQNIYTYSDFLTAADVATLDLMREELSFMDYSLFGGYDEAERVLVGFGSEAMFGYEGIWPIAIIKVEPLLEKFADVLSHRDFLGALMNLGLERDKMGDILVKDGKRAFVVCKENMVDFIVENLTKIKHTNVKCTLVSDAEALLALAPELVELNVIVSAARFDAVLAGVLKCSRSEALALFQAGKVTLNGRLCERNSMTLKDGDIFSVRGYGKYKYCGAGNETRKGRIYVHLQQYK